MSCADVQTIKAGNGVQTQFSFDFPYILKSEIQVSFWNNITEQWDVKLTTDATYPWQIADANPTIVEFTGTPPPSPVNVDNIRIRRITNISDIRALFNPGSSIRSDDLNKNFEQLRFAIQEANCQENVGQIIAGGTLAGPLDMDGFKITNADDPTNPQDVATKAYVDSVADPTIPPGNTILVDSDIGVTVQPYDATYLVDADIDVTVQSYDADTAKTDVAQTFTAQQTFGELKETVFTLGTTGSIALAPANGSIQSSVLTGDPTFTDSLEPGQTIVLMLEGGASYTVTWPTITWVTSGGNVAPTLTAKDTLVFWKVSTTLYGAYVGSYV